VSADELANKKPYKCHMYTFPINRASAHLKQRVVPVHSGAVENKAKESTCNYRRCLRSGLCERGEVDDGLGAQRARDLFDWGYG
jgi:hypothetical protein